jgi:hypothetical protein
MPLAERKQLGSVYAAALETEENPGLAHFRRREGPAALRRQPCAKSIYSPLDDKTLAATRQVH